MELYDKSHFRITPWPLQGVPLPKSIETRSSGITSTPDGVLEVITRPTFPGEEPTRTRKTPTPGQLYLRVANTDLGNHDEVVQLLSDIGPLGLTRLVGGQYGAPFGGLLDYYEDYEDQIAEELLEEGLEFTPDECECRWIALGDLDQHRETLDQFLAAAGLIQDAVAIKRLLLDGEFEVPEWRMIEIFAHSLPIWDNHSYTLQEWTLDPLERETAAALSFVLDLIVSSALTAFAPRLTDRLTNWEGKTSNVDLWTFVPTYSLMMAELFNHIVLQAPTRRCANERCNNLFVYQDGRLTKGTNRSRGVMYCSASCARAVAQRAYRSRKRVARNTEFEQCSRRIDHASHPT